MHELVIRLRLAPANGSTLVTLTDEAVDALRNAVYDAKEVFLDDIQASMDDTVEVTMEVE